MIELKTVRDLLKLKKLSGSNWGSSTFKKFSLDAKLAKLSTPITYKSLLKAGADEEKEYIYLIKVYQDNAFECSLAALKHGI